MKQHGQSPSSTDLFRASVYELLLYIPKATEPRAQELGLCRWKILALKLLSAFLAVSWASRLTSRGHRTPAVRWGHSWCLAQNTQRSIVENTLSWAWSEHLVPGTHLLLLLLIIERALCEMCTLPAVKIYWSAGGGRAGIGIALQRGVQGWRLVCFTETCRYQHVKAGAWGGDSGLSQGWGCLCCWDILGGNGSLRHSLELGDS